MSETRRKAPFAVAALDNFGVFEGRVLSIKPKENKKGNAQCYIAIEQRITRPDNQRVSYNILYFVAFNEVAETMLRFVKPDKHLRVRYRVTSFKPPGRPSPIISLQVELFRIYEQVEDDLESWMKKDGVFDASPDEMFRWDPEAEASCA